MLNSCYASYHMARGKIEEIFRNVLFDTFLGGEYGFEQGEEGTGLMQLRGALPHKNMVIERSDLYGANHMHLRK